MKKIDLGKTITILANVGVLVGILLLVYELNQNRQMTAAQIRSDLADASMTLQLAAATSSDLRDIWLRILAGQEVQPFERARWQDFLGAMFRNWEHQHFQYRNGLYDATEYNGVQETWRQALSDPTIREVWCGRESRMSGPFVAAIDEMFDGDACL